MSKICEQCQSEFTPSRKDARFCTPTCKSKYWYKKKGEDTEEISGQNELHTSLKGVIDETLSNSPISQQEEFDVVTVKKESMTYKELKSKEISTLIQKALFEKKIKQVLQDITNIKNNNGLLLTAACTDRKSVV